jgi:hypothetical protein
LSAAATLLERIPTAHLRSDVNVRFRHFSNFTGFIERPLRAVQKPTIEPTPWPDVLSAALLTRSENPLGDAITFGPLSQCPLVQSDYSRRAYLRVDELKRQLLVLHGNRRPDRAA